VGLVRVLSCLLKKKNSIYLAEFHGGTVSNAIPVSAEVTIVVEEEEKEAEKERSLVDCLVDEFAKVCKEYESVECEDDEDHSSSLHLDILFNKIVFDGDEGYSLEMIKTLSYGWKEFLKPNKDGKYDKDVGTVPPKYCLSSEDTARFFDFVLSLPDGIKRRMR
jgi:metal-dependent amidase/aminoacylase/carboxypeptidase family protein